MDSAAFLDVALQNQFNREILRRLPDLALPQGHLVAGCLFQTLWNVQSGQAPEARIKDYDVFYFEGGDLSYEAEDRVIRAAERLFADLPVQVEVAIRRGSTCGTRRTSACPARRYRRRVRASTAF